jgi:phenylalanyl-tRNA synthetase beta chain
VVVAEVLEIEPHPDADKLRVCRVDAGQGEPLQIVCGAPNVHVGMKAPLIMIGGRLPDGTNVKKTKLRGVESGGMLCSARELGLAEEAAGLLALPADAVPGQSLAELLQLDDTIIDIELTPNRGDCLSVLGVAREAGAVQDLDVRLPDIAPVAAVHDQRLPVEVRVPEACARFTGRIIRNTDPQAVTPLWIQERLRRAGIRPISPAVDITQYVMLEFGQPLHAYDLHKINGGIVVRYAQPDESLLLLDGNTVKLTDDMLIIADHARPLGLAGIMGGEDSAVGAGTQDVYLECAWFAPQVIHGRGRRLGLQTDASYRFERGVDPDGQIRALERATRLLLDIVGGEPGPLDETAATECLPERLPVSLNRSRLHKLLGIEIPASQVESSLQRLGMQVGVEPEGWSVLPPGFRFDIAIEPDLIEEVARIYGYEKIPPRHYAMPQQMKPEPEAPDTLVRLREVLVQRGYQEVITYTFVDESMQRRLMGDEPGLALANPITAEMTQMRSSLWPGLIQTLQHNLNRQQGRVRIFETGLKFVPQGDEIKQENVVAGLVYGPLYPAQWGLAPEDAEYPDLKGDVEALLSLGAEAARLEFAPVEHAALNPGQSAEILLDNQRIGIIGQLHPAIRADLELPQPALLFELRIDAIKRDLVPKFRELSRFPSVRRDLALVVPEAVPARKILDCIGNLAADMLNKLELFDVYRGEGIDSGQKSLAVGLTFQKSSSTLTDCEVDALVSKILDAVREAFGAELRE